MGNEKGCVCSAPNCCDTEQRSASQPGSVVSATHYIFHTGLWTAFEQDRDGTAVPSWSCSKAVYKPV